MKTLLTVFIISLSISISWAARPAKELQDLLNSVHSVTATFVQKTYSGKRGQARTLQGNLAIKKPGRFRWNITSPSHASMISNGKVLWVYNKDLKQVTIKKVDKNKGSSPAMVLSHRLKLLGNYFRVWHKNGLYYLNPRYGNDELKQVQLKFSGNKLSQMWIIDKLGQKSYLRFSNIRTNVRLSNSLFNFHAPKGVDVIR